jgi:hypothetical protein
MRRGALLLCLSLAAQGQPVAQVEGRPVTAAEIEPDARDTNHFRSQLSAGQFTQWRDQARAGRLASRIWQAVKTDFCRTRQCEPTEADLDAWVQASAAREQERRVRDAARIAGLEKRIAKLAPDAPERRQLEEELRVTRAADESLRQGNAESHRRTGILWVGAWKFNREMYRAYGGRVIFQQAGPEPLEAMTRLLREHEKKGTFVIYDPELRRRFWAYYTTMGHAEMPDGAKFLETPWWLQKKP